MPNRGFTGSQSYRYGFNSQEKDDEIKGAGNSYGAEFWEYDPRTVRRWNLDPKPAVGTSQYSVFGNNPILFNDPYGDTTVTAAGGTKSVDIDEKQNSLQFYGSTGYMVAGTNTTVPVQPGQLRSFSNGLGKFSARWTTDANGNAVFAGYKNDKNQTLEVAVAELREYTTGLKGAFYKWMVYADGLYRNSQREPLEYNLKLSATLFTLSAMSVADPVPYSPGPNPSLTTQESMSGLGTLNISTRSMSLVTKYPANGVVSGTLERKFLMPDEFIDRYGPLSGRWFSTPGTSYGARSIPPGLSPYTRFKVLKPFEVQKSLSAPGMFSGQFGFGVQYESPVGADILIKRGIITPF